jgi:hypothetical protein
MLPSTFTLVLVLTASSGATTQHLIADYSSLKACETAGHSRADSQRPLYMAAQVQWYCMENPEPVAGDVPTLD